MRNNKQFIVLGLGRFGQSIAKTLLDNNCEVLCCDKSIELVNEISEYGCHALQADVTDAKALEELGINNFDVVIVAIGGNMEASILATMFAKEMGAKMIIAKAKTDVQKSVLKRIGADRVVFPEREMGFKIANSLISTNIIDYINLSNEFAIVEIEPIKRWVNKTLLKCKIRDEYGLNIVAIKRDNKIIVSPNPAETIRQEDILVVIGESHKLQKIK